MKANKICHSEMPMAPCAYISEDRHVDDERPIQEARSVVSTKDHQELPVLTFRVWIIGLMACNIQAFFRAKVPFEETAYVIPIIVIQIMTLLAGISMAELLPNITVRVPRTSIKISLNPGAFGSKEYMLCCIFAIVGRMRPLLLQTVAGGSGYLTLPSNLTCCLFVGLFWVMSPLCSLKWNFLQQINLPVLLAATAGVLPAVPATINWWLFVGISFPVILCQFTRRWSPKHLYILSVSLSAGAALASGLVYVFGNDSPNFHCSLARCPTVPGMAAEG